jgi:hypothetical protein
VGESSLLWSSIELLNDFHFGKKGKKDLKFKEEHFEKGKFHSKNEKERRLI